MGIRDREVREEGSRLRYGRPLEFADRQEAEAASASRQFGRCAMGEAEGWLWVRAGRERYRPRVGFRARKKKKQIGGGDRQQENVFCHISIILFVLGPPVRSISSVGCKVETHPTVETLGG
jgi:hypothetical protein